LPGFRYQGEKRHAGGHQRYPHRHLADDPGAASHEAVGQNTDPLPGHEFENTPENAREILGNLGKNIDVVGGIFDETMLELRNCSGLELSRVPFGCAVSMQHRLAALDKLKIEDLYGENLLLMRRGWSGYVDSLRDDIWKNHSQINIVDFDFYNMDIFNRCENSSDVLLAIPGWANVHPFIRVIPVEWDYSIPYGLLHAPQPTPTVQKFLKAAKEAVGESYNPQV